MPVVRALNKHTKKPVLLEMFYSTGIECLEELKKWAPGYRIEIIDQPEPAICHIDDLGLVHLIGKDAYVAKANRNGSHPFLWVLDKDWFEETYSVVSG